MARRLRATFGAAYRSRHPLTIEERVARIAARHHLLPWQRRIFHQILEEQAFLDRFFKQQSARPQLIYHMAAARVTEPQAFVRVTGAGL